MRLKFFLTSVVLIAAIGLIVLLIVKRDPSPVISQKVNLGIHRGPHSSLIYIALDQGFFQKNGVVASIKEYEAGRFAADALLAGEVDIATFPEFIHVSKSFGDPTLRILATINTAEDQEIVARRDSGIKEVKDLAGKKIAVGLQGISRFFLETFLTAGDVRIKSIVPVDLPPSKMGEAISSGSVDAVATFSPYNLFDQIIFGGQCRFLVVPKRSELLFRAGLKREFHPIAWRVD